MKKITALLVLFILSFSLFSCDAMQQQYSRTSLDYFDTPCLLVGFEQDKDAFDSTADEVFSLLEKYHRLFDIYHEYDGIVNLCTLNRAAGGKAMAVDEALFDLLLYAKEMYNETDGKVNVMMGSVLSLWHDCREEGILHPENAALPDEQALRNAALHTDIALLELEEQGRLVRISDASASIDVGAVAKGFATQRVAEYLKEKGKISYAVNFGGNIRVTGSKPQTELWTVGVESPFEEETDYLCRLSLADTALSTSGSYQRFYTVNGVRYHHLIDPETLYPSHEFASVTVLTENAARADALSTCFFLLPLNRGQALAETLSGVEVLWVLPDGEIVHTSGFPF